MTGITPGTWYAIAADQDVPHRHVYRTMLAGHELVAWRASDGGIQVWDNRCPHRGVRLSLGEVVGDELRCQYHAWRFGKSGVCTFIPAQPDMTVPGTIRARAWPVAVAGGLVWTGTDPVGPPPAMPAGAVIRALPVRRAHTDISADLPSIVLTVQPMDDRSSMLRGIATDGDVVRADLAVLALRRRLEACA